MDSAIITWEELRRIPEETLEEIVLNMLSAVEAACIEEEERRNIPAELVEEILLKLPVRPLLSFTRVSKTWRSMIFDLGFVKRHRSAERIIVTSLSSSSVSLCAPSSVLSKKNVTEMVCPFGGSHRYHVVATCDDLWCVQVQHDNSLYLWDPPLKIYRKVPDPVGDSLCYGLGYDSSVDDYKLLSISAEKRSLLYSVRSNCWREIDECFPESVNPDDRCVYLDGSLHWIGYCYSSNSALVISFNLSTEKYTELIEPEFELGPHDHSLDLSVLKGKLCVGLNSDTKFMWWMKMEDSWVKIIEMEYLSCFPDCYRMTSVNRYLQWVELKYVIKSRPFYFCDKGDIFIQIDSSHYKQTCGVFVYKEEKGTRTMKRALGEDFAGYNYVEKLYFSRIIMPH